MVDLSPKQQRALAAVQAAWPDADVLLVGALALSHHIPLHYRHTDDLDVAVAIPIEAFPGPLASLEGWTGHAQMEHRFCSAEGQSVDILPAGPALRAQGYIEWPSGIRMSLQGFDLAFAHASPVSIGDLTLAIPHAPALTLLKICAWLDRPAARKKDLQDLAHLLSAYLADDDPRRWDDDVVARGLNVDDVSAFILGRELGGIVGNDHRTALEAFFDKATPEQLAAAGPIAWRGDEDNVERAETALHVFRQGLSMTATPSAGKKS